MRLLFLFAALPPSIAFVRGTFFAQAQPMSLFATLISLNIRFRLIDQIIRFTFRLNHYRNGGVFLGHDPINFILEKKVLCAHEKNMKKTQQRTKHFINSFTFLHRDMGCGKCVFFYLIFMRVKQNNSEWTEFLISFNVSNQRNLRSCCVRLMLGYERLWQCDNCLLITIWKVKLPRKKLIESAQKFVCFSNMFAEKYSKYSNTNFCSMIVSANFYCHSHIGVR